jgi:hypothetical protein
MDFNNGWLSKAIFLSFKIMQAFGCTFIFILVNLWMLSIGLYGQVFVICLLAFLIYHSEQATKNK